jgi:pantothenate kinase
MSSAEDATIDALADHLIRRSLDGQRQIIGIVGAPGVGKSTVAERVAERLGASAVVVPMDGFHLSNAVLDGLGLQQRKGAVNTFDGGGYVSLLRRLRARDEPVVYAPRYERGIEEGIVASIAIPRDASFVLTEGNYLLVDEQPWFALKELLDESWFIDTSDETRVARLIERHIRFGRNAEDAESWANGTDAINARRINSTRGDADQIIQWN